MKILHVSSFWDPYLLGGAEVYAANLAAEQRLAGHDVGVITHGIPGEMVVEAVPTGPIHRDLEQQQARWRRAIFRLEDIYNPLAAARITKAIRRFGADVVHSHGVQGLGTVSLTAGASLAPHVHQLHDHWLLCRRTTMTLPNGELCQDMSCRVIAAIRAQIVKRHPPELLLAYSQVSARAHETLSWTAGRFRQLPQTIGVEYEGVRSRPFDPSKPLTFGYLGQLVPHKGIDTLLRAFEGLGGGHRLLIAGEGALAPMVEAAATGNVTYLGRVDGEAKERFFADVDCMVLPSRCPDVAPLVVLESRARGVPVIGARIGGIPTLLGDRCAPLLFEPGSADELRASVERFIAEPSRFVPSPDEPPVRIGRTWADHASDVVEFYQEAIELRRQRIAGSG
ncbi:MAG TPA: glycosyltransferase [Mycobacteriales bacterium]|nr:glycosyltransferase [Mycobacteriales bacterium]